MGPSFPLECIVDTQIQLQLNDDARSFKFGLQSENNGLRPKTKFDPQNGRGFWSRDHFCNFRNSHISPERLMLQSSNFVCYQISLVLSSPGSVLVLSAKPLLTKHIFYVTSVTRRLLYTTTRS